MFSGAMTAPVFVVLVVIRFVGTNAWDYAINGKDWSGEGMCGSGGAQSPVNLPASAPVAEDEMTMFLKYPKLASAVRVYHNGNSIALTLPDTFRAGFGIGKGSDGVKAFESEEGDAYRLWQVNFHSPSEHTINGERLPLEMQMMHQQVTGGDGMAVVVVLFNKAPNAYGALLDAIIGQHLPKTPWEEALRQPPLEFAPVLGRSLFYSYEGSLTVPPCEKQVKYFVRKEPVPAAHAQLEQFRKVLQGTSAMPRGNYRLLQPLTGRVALLGTSDIVTAPGVIVKPKKPTLQEEQVDSADPHALDGNCNSDYFDKADKNVYRVQVGESLELFKAKTLFNNAKKDQIATSNGIAGSTQKVNMLKRLYDSAPGPVEKIDVKWKLTNAETILEAHQKALPEKVETEKHAHEALMEALIRACVQKSQKNPKEAVERNAAVREHGNVLPKKEKNEKVVRRWSYPQPHVKLPVGLGGSPFSIKAPDGDKVVMSEKIAANLQQPDIPPSGSLTAAVGQDNDAKKAAKPETLLEMRFPIAPGSVVPATFTADLLKALAETAHISESRLEVQEVKQVAFPKVVEGDPAATALAQRRSEQHRYLRQKR